MRVVHINKIILILGDQLRASQEEHVTANGVACRNPDSSCELPDRDQPQKPQRQIYRDMTHQAQTGSYS
jgi:hypothetical protein